MSYESKKAIKDKRSFSKFLIDKLEIDEDFELIDNILPYYFLSDAMAYTFEKGKICLMNKTSETLYYICKNENLSKIREGSRFIIMHELGHFHDLNYANPRANKYLEELLFYSHGAIDETNAFPESEATRYALEKSNNYIDSLAGFVAISAFTCKSNLEESLKTMEDHFSLKNLDPSSERYNKLREISNFRLSKETRKKIEDKALDYINLLKGNLKINAFGHVVEKD